KPASSRGSTKRAAARARLPLSGSPSSCMTSLRSSHVVAGDASEASDPDGRTAARRSSPWYRAEIPSARSRRGPLALLLVTACSSEGPDVSVEDTSATGSSTGGSAGEPPASSSGEAESDGAGGTSDSTGAGTDDGPPPE